MNLFSSITYTSWAQEAIKFIPITEFDFQKENIHLDECLDHGFSDLNSFFPSWNIFLKRSTGEEPNYPNYMTYLMIKPQSVDNSGSNKEDLRSSIIGVLAVQLVYYNDLKGKNVAITKVEDIEHYLYLSWIALDQRYQAYNYFAMLFEYYNSLIRRFREILDMNLQGIAVIIRRMREVIWGLFNDNNECPTTVDKEFSKISPRFDVTFVPYEIFKKSFTPKQDHILIEFKSRNIVV